jgi:5-methylcytosine-specific restriction endonuclease McrA
MPTKGSAYRAEGNPALRTACASCGRSIPTEVGHAHPLDEGIRRETWGLVGYQARNKMVFPTCTACHDAGWRPPGFVWMN